MNKKRHNMQVKLDKRLSIVKFLTFRKAFKQIIWLFSVSIISPNSFAAIESIDKIIDVAERYALTELRDESLSNIVATAIPIDSRLRLAECEIPLEAFSTSQTTNLSRKTIGVKCSGDKPWSLYIPVNITADTEVVFSNRPLMRGETIKKDDLIVKLVSLTKLPPNYVNNLDTIIGMELTRSLNYDEIITINSVKIKPTVQQGQEVIIIARTANLQVKMKGVALKNGKNGELIPIRNTTSGNTIKAVVLNNSTVSVNM